MKKLILFSFIALVVSSCSENYSNGERIGLVTQFSQSGIMWKSWEGHLNLTQTGMNSSSAVPFDFSIDNDHEDTTVIHKIDSAAQFGWKVKIIFHETMGKNWWSNRGKTNHFVCSLQVLDRDPIGNIFGNSRSNVGQLSNGGNDSMYHIRGRALDTIYVVIIPKERVKP